MKESINLQLSKSEAPPAGNSEAVKTGESDKSENIRALEGIRDICVSSMNSAKDENEQVQLDQEFMTNILPIAEKIKDYEFERLEEMEVMDCFCKIAEYFKERIQKNPKNINLIRSFLAKLCHHFSILISDGQEALTLEEADEFDKLINKKDLEPQELFELKKIRIKLNYIDESMNLPEKWNDMDFHQFDPYFELKKINSLDDYKGGQSQEERLSEKKRRLKNYRKTIYQQKEGLAETILELEKMVRKDPDASHDEMHQFVYVQAEKYKLSNNQIFLLEKGLSKFHCRHETIKLYHEEFDSKELYELCFGRYPHGKIEVVRGSLSLYFRVFTPEDYAYILSGSYSGDSSTRKDKKRAKMSGGAKIDKCLVPELDDCITLEKAESNKMSERVFDHEEFHAMEELFPELDEQGYYLKDIERAPDEYKSYFAVNALRTERLTFENQAKSEILAYYQGSEDFFGIIMLLQKKGLYDFFEQSKETIEYYILHGFLEKEGFSAYDIRRLFNKVFIEEYGERIKSAVMALKGMDRLSVRHGWPKKKLMYYLKNEELGNWPNVHKSLKAELG